MAEDDQVHGRLPDELAERLGQAPLSEARRPCSGRRKSLSPLPSRNNGVCTSRMRCHGGRGRLLPDLAPFMNLLPAEIILSELKDQELLRTILLDVGRHAYSHLVKYLSSRPGPIKMGATLNDFIPPPPNQLTNDQMVMLSECLDDAVDSIRDIANHPGFKDTSTLHLASRETIPEELRQAICVDMITPEMASTALTLLTASAFRRPPTRMVESMMAASQEAQTNGVEGDSQREGTETLDESVPPPPASDDSLLGLACSTGLWELAMLMVRVRQSGDFMGEAECTPLMEACAAGHEKIVRQMIPYSADLNTQSVTQNTALIYASAAGHLDCVEVLLDAGATRGIDLDLKNENGHCALMEAASGGHLEIVKRLIEAGSASLRMNVNSEFKESPLTLAAYKGHRDLVAYLLTLDLGETREEELHTALMEASMDGHIEVAEILLKSGAPVNLPSDSFESPLTLAACGGHADLVKMLLDAGASIEEPNDESYTPLMEAAREGHSDVVRLLLDAGACVNATTEETGETAMTLAACGGFTEIVEMILDGGGDLEAGANTPLMEAATEGHHHTAAGIIRMMRERNHDKDPARLPTIIEHVSSALVQAADNGHYQIVAELGRSGFVDLNFQMEGNRTALMKAAKGGYRDIIRHLVSIGADANVRAATGDVTALSLACAGGHYDTVAELLQSNADPNVILKDGVTCVLEAARHGYVHIVELLLDYRGPNAVGGPSGPKPNRKVATPRRTVTAARKLASAAGGTQQTAAAAGAAAAERSLSKVDEILGSFMATTTSALPPLSPAHTCGKGGGFAAAAAHAAAHHHHPAAGGGGGCAKHKHLPNTPQAAHFHVHGAGCSASHGHGHDSRHNHHHGHHVIDIEFEPPVCALPHSGNAACCFQARGDVAGAAVAKAAYAAGLAAAHATDSVSGSGESPPRELSAAMLAEKIRRIPADLQDRILAEMDGAERDCGVGVGVGAGLKDALVRTFLADETIVQRLAAGDTVSLNTKTGETSAGVQLPLPPAADAAAAKRSLAARSKAKKEAQRGERTGGLQPGGGRERSRSAIEDEAVDAVRETFMVAKAQLAAAQAVLTKDESAAAAGDAAPVAAAAPVGSPSKAAAAAAIAAAATGARTKDPGAQASEMMKKMANAIPMPGKDQELAKAQMDSFHRFHNFLVRTAKGENPPPPALGAGQVLSAAAAAVFVGSQVAAGCKPSDLPDAVPLYTPPDGDEDPMVARNMFAAAAAAAIEDCNRMDSLSSASPSPCPSSPMLQPLMTASSDEFVSENRTPVHVKRRSASVPHDSSNPRWPSDAMLRQHAKCLQKKVAAQQTCGDQAGGPKGEPGVPPPSKRPTGPNRQGPTAVRACTEKRPLAATSTFDVDMQTESNNDTPLTLACSNGHTAMVELLVQRGANVHHRDKKGFTPLILAATGGHLQIVQSLLDHGANIETQSERTKDTALSLACSGGKKEVADMLLKRGANKEHRNVSDYTPLSLAASGGYVDICNMLLDAGAEINSRTGSKLGISPLMLAAMNGHKDATRVLLERGSDINAQIETNRNTALTLACFQVNEGSCECCRAAVEECGERARRDEGRTEVVRLLLQYNANVEHRAKTGLTPLMEAANGGYVEVGQLLLEAYADPNTSPVPSSRDTALTIAADKGHDKFVELLLKNGAMVDARNKKGCTALWLACHGGHLETVQALVKHKKTNVEMEDNRKVSPLMIAFRKGHLKIVKFLVKWVAQFPGDAELCRYIQTVTEQDLMTRCHDCMNVIVSAKDKQAAQANLAADALIAQIEAEEEQARSKKLSKQRQKEKKKAKKQEKKKQEDVKEDSEDEEEEVVVVPEVPKVVPKEEPKKAEVAKAAAVAAAAAVADKTKANKTPLAAAAAAKGKARAAAAAAVSAAVAARAQPVEVTPEREVEKVEERIPGMNLPPAAAPAAAAAAEEAAAAPSNAARKRETAADRRAANRRSRNESGKNNGAAAAAPMQQPLPSLMAAVLPPPSSAVAAAMSPLQQLRSPPAVQQSIMSPLASPRGAAATQEEWVKANKKGRNAKAAAAAPVARSSSATQKLTDPTEENALAMWNNIEASRRRMATLTVSSPCIARVIGRGGANINAIREATGASIEVERQADKTSSRRGDADREICIRGTAETVKNAVAMINGLIAETDVTVNEIIRLVRNSASPSEQPRYAPDAYTKMAAATAVSAAGGAAHAGRAAAAAAAAAAATAPSNTTNVWQQRMAARQAQDAALRPTPAAATAAAAPAAYMAAAAAAANHVSPPAAPHSPAPTTRSDDPSPATTRASTPPRTEQHEELQQQEVVEVEATPPPAPVAAAPPTAAPVTTFEQLQQLQQDQQQQQQQEELQQIRKAPGFARPSAAAPAAVYEQRARSPSPAPARPTALPSTPLHDRVPDLSQHMMSFGGAGDNGQDLQQLQQMQQQEERMREEQQQQPSLLAKQDSSSALFNDNTFRSIAEIWGDTAGGGGDLTSASRSAGGGFGGAWDNALLLNSFNNINLSKPDWADYTTSSSSVSAMDSSTSIGGGGAFSSGPSTLHSSHSTHGSAPSAAAAAHYQQQQQQLYSSSSNSTIPSASSAFGLPGADLFAANGPRSGPLFARGANAAAVARAAPAAAPKQQQAGGGNALDSIFNNVAAALMQHQTGATSTSMPVTTSAAAAAAAANSYYPSPSYTDPSAMGLGSLKGYGNGGTSNGAAAAYQQQQNAFTRMQQTTVLHQLQQKAAAQQLAASQRAAAEASMQSRMREANGYPPPPPPGFNQLNTVLPPPSLASRSAATSAYFSGQMAPQPGSGAPGAQSPFHLYAQNGWPTNGMSQKQQQQQAAQPTMNGAAANGRNGNGASSFYSNGWN